MRQAGLRGLAAVPRRTRTTDSRHTYPIAPNRLGRNFVANRPGQVWVADMTYIPTGEGWLYLAAVLDLYSRRIVGLAMSDRMTADLVAVALQQALTRRKPSAELIHHSDRGCQYTSQKFQALLREYGILISMSGTGNCYDN